MFLKGAAYKWDTVSEQGTTVMGLQGEGSWQMGTGGTDAGNGNNIEMEM